MANESLTLAHDAARVQRTDECAHHWVLEAPNGAVSHGRCRVCGAIKEFRNSTADFVWEEERKSAMKAWSNEVREARSA